MSGNQPLDYERPVAKPRVDWLKWAPVLSAVAGVFAFIKARQFMYNERDTVVLAAVAAAGLLITATQWKTYRGRPAGEQAIVVLLCLLTITGATAALVHLARVGKLF